MTLQTTPLARKKLIDILAQVSLETGVEVTDIIGPVKRALFFQARCLFARRADAEGYVARDIAEALGRCRTAVVHYLEEEGEEDMTKEEMRKSVKSLTKEEKKELVKTIAEDGTKEDRDNLAEFFSSVERSRVADVEKDGAGGKARDELPATNEKAKSWMDEL